MVEAQQGQVEVTSSFDVVRVQLKPVLAAPVARGRQEKWVLATSACTSRAALGSPTVKRWLLLGLPIPLLAQPVALLMNQCCPDMRWTCCRSWAKLALCSARTASWLLAAATDWRALWAAPLTSASSCGKGQEWRTGKRVKEHAL